MSWEGGKRRAPAVRVTQRRLGRARVTGETSNFACDEPNTKGRNLLLSLTSIYFFTCEVRRLSVWLWHVSTRNSRFININLLKALWKRKKATHQPRTKSALTDYLHVRTVGMREVNIRKRSEKNKQPVLLKTLLPSFPIPWYNNPMRRPTEAMDTNRRWVNTRSLKTDWAARLKSTMNWKREDKELSYWLGFGCSTNIKPCYMSKYAGYRTFCPQVTSPRLLSPLF